MSTYKLWWLLLTAILRGQGKAPVYFDTEGKTYEYHLAKVGSVYLEDPWQDKVYYTVLYEER